MASRSESQTAMERRDAALSGGQTLIPAAIATWSGAQTHASHVVRFVSTLLTKVLA